MSTRATIACEQEDGGYAAIDLHFDGYQDHAGRDLKKLDKWTDHAIPIDVDQLIYNDLASDCW
ncbi:hypothetical protein VN12_24445 [Pirellula sp. SH-Sr6A]|uniref:hypothetical protein n=1 Tax=Pirellula sp. SH-Sr6A TaxID=1632865 RepID=UPI00078E7CD4|nr:hypothetical protein [Pirellula sp. SH-Sr6A]AMV35298.1 hypothetical protein VN12_24445 [Pirellula sp. SH-Sr6A]